MPNKYTKFFIEQYPKKFVSKARKKAKQLGYKILKKGFYIGDNKIKIRNLHEIFYLLDMPFINSEYANQLFGGAYDAPPRKKLQINPQLAEAISMSLQGQQAKYRPPEEKIPEAPPLSLPMEASLAPPLLSRAMVPQHIPLSQRNIVEELKEYKDGIKYLKDICPMLKRTYIRKYKGAGNKYSPTKEELDELEEINKDTKAPDHCKKYRNLVIPEDCRYSIHWSDA